MSRPSACGRIAAQALAFLAGILLLAALSACHPVESWRNLTGASKNAPNPQTTPNTRNLAAGAKEPYPNLATVPPAPTRGLTEGEIKKLTRSLLADRANAKYSAESLSSRAKPLAPPPLTAALQEKGGLSTAAEGAPGKAKEGANGTNGAGGPRQGPQPAPLESSLRMPRIPSPPAPEAAAPPPPAPSLSPAPKLPAASLAMLPPPQRPVAPPRPLLPVPAPAGRPPRALPAKPHKESKALPAKPLRLASITFPPGDRSLSPAIRKEITTVAAGLRARPGTIRVISYAAGGGGALAELNSFSAALAEGQAVAGALKAAGIPQNKIKVVASPTTLPLGLSRVDILLLP